MKKTKNYDKIDTVIFVKKLLVVVDYQVDFVIGSLGFPKAKTLEEGIIDKIIEFENNDDDVVFTLDTHYDNYFETIEGINLPVKHCIKGTKGHELYGNVKNMISNHPVILKETFGSDKLLEFLKDKEYNEIAFCGVVTNICVISNAIIAKSALPNTKITIFKDLVASNNLELENKSFDVMKNLHMNII